MPKFVYVCRDVGDREEAARIRREVLPAHLAYVEQHMSSYAVAGPNRDPDGAYRSNTFIIDAIDLQTADMLMAADPYTEAGLYREVQGVEFVPVAGEWVGGASYKK